MALGETSAEQFLLFEASMWRFEADHPRRLKGTGRLLHCCCTFLSVSGNGRCVGLDVFAFSS